MTKQEQKILALLKENPTISNAEIAEALGKSLKTIETQLSSIYKRLHIQGDNCQRRIALILILRNLN